MSVSEAAVEDISVDWRGRPSKSTKHGGMKAAVFVLGLSLSLCVLCLLINFIFSTMFILIIIHIHDLQRAPINLM